jgi:hypothetical protein
MASILISFVGNQDPYSDNTEQEGSIVTLVKHLCKSDVTLKKVILLHTETTQQRAKDTRDYLEEVKISASCVDIIPVDPQLSTDPVNLLLASKEAYKAIETVQQDIEEGDRLEFNASSGTPVMKSAWSILQAAGKAPQSTVWQVRNPKEVREGQEPVFKTDVSIFKDEFDFQVIKRQIQNYNYSGALVDLKISNLSNSDVEALLHCGYYRLAFDFNRAFNSIQNLSLPLAKSLRSQLSALRQKDQRALLEEIYNKIKVKDKKEEYADLLVLIFSFQETLLRFLVVQKILPQKVNKSWSDNEKEIQKEIESLDSGEMKRFLEKYTFPNGKQLYIFDERHLSRIALKAILEYQPSPRNSEL